MDLKPAIALASRYATKDEGPEQCVRLVPSPRPRVLATSGDAGIVIECPTIATLPEPMAVPAVALKRMVDAIGSDAVLAIAKGRKLTISGDGVTLGLQAWPENKAPTTPEPPDAGWFAVERGPLAALASVATVVDPEIRGNTALAGVALTPAWSAGASAQLVALAWVKLPLPVPILVVPADLFHGLANDDGAVYVPPDGRSCWLRQRDQARWTRTLNVPWPAEAVVAVITAARTAPGRVHALVSLPALAQLARRSTAATETKAEAFRLTVGGMHVRLQGGDPSGRHGARDFDGTIGDPPSGPLAGVNVSPFALQLLADLLCMGGPDGALSVCGERDPVLMWGGDPVVEAMMLPVILA